MPLAAVAALGGLVSGLGLLGPVLNIWTLAPFLPLSRPFDCMMGLAGGAFIALALSRTPKKILARPSGVTVSRGLLIGLPSRRHPTARIEGIVARRVQSHRKDQRAVYRYPLFLKLSDNAEVELHRYDEIRHARSAGLAISAALGEPEGFFTEPLPGDG
ncbi:MAG: hypothetical protein ACI8RZ_002219 [Myxococcota bacterium]|jgi:hypothetical protein